MIGNVREWCKDWYGDYSSDAITDHMGSENGAHRVIRRRGWDCNPANC